MILAIIIAFIAGALFGIAMTSILAMSYDKREEKNEH